MSFEIENEKTTKEKKHERYFDEFKLPTIFFMQSKFNISHVLWRVHSISSKNIKQGAGNASKISS